MRVITSPSKITKPLGNSHNIIFKIRIERHLFDSATMIAKVET